MFTTLLNNSIAIMLNGLQEETSYILNGERNMKISLRQCKIRHNTGGYKTLCRTRKTGKCCTMEKEV
jgi:hypothetical protein